MKFFFALIFLLTSSCTSKMDIDKFKESKPEFSLENYFEGKTEAWGMFHDRFGNLKRSFKVDITGILNDGTLTLDEKFVYDDGEKDSRVWTIEILGDNTYKGRASDVVGEAKGIASGNALNWQYRLNLKVGDGTILVDFDDWMFLQDRGILMNRAEIKKWGFVVGVVSITFLKID